MEAFFCKISITMEKSPEYPGGEATAILSLATSVAPAGEDKHALARTSRDDVISKLLRYFTHAKSVKSVYMLSGCKTKRDLQEHS